MDPLGKIAIGEPLPVNHNLVLLLRQPQAMGEFVLLVLLTQLNASFNLRYLL